MHIQNCGKVREHVNKRNSRLVRKKWIVTITPDGGTGFRVNLEPPGAQGTANGYNM